MSEADEILDGLGDRNPVRLRRGKYVGLDTDLLSALVDMGDSRFACDFGAGYIPVVGEAVQVLSVGPRHMMLPLGPKPGVGVVASQAAPYVNVTTAIGDIKMPYIGTIPTSGQLVGISWSEGPRCIGVLSTSADTIPAPPDPGGPGGLKTVTFNAIDAGSTDRGAPRWWTAQPWASNSTYGAWFYGSQIKDTIPSGATFVSLEFYVARVQDLYAAPRFALHDAGTKGPIPGFAAYTEWDPGNGWQVPPDPAGWFAALKAGGAYAGVGLNQGGFNKFASLAQDRSSGALRISWRT